jgi:hypothetical protein
VYYSGNILGVYKRYTAPKFSDGVGEGHMSITNIGASLLIVGLIVGSISGYGLSYVVDQPQISQLQFDLTEAQTNITSLQEDITSLQGNITSLVGQRNALNATVLPLQTQLAEAQAEIIPGRVPILHVGDWWTMKIVHNGTTYTLTTNVTEDDQLHYILYSSYDPPYQGLMNSTDRVDKSTLNPVEVRPGGSSGGGETLPLEDVNFMTILSTYEGGVLYPLIVGKELKLTEIMTYNMTTKGKTWTYSMNHSLTVNVKAIENVTVSATTVECFRIDMRNQLSGDLVYTAWYTDDAKNYVKYIDYTTTPETTYELLRYVVKKADGSGGGNVAAGWDLEKNVKI